MQLIGRFELFNYMYHFNLHNRSSFLVKYHLPENGFIDRNYSCDDTKCSRYAFRYDSRDEYIHAIKFVNYSTQWNVIVGVSEILRRTVVDD